jgi:hypothetical protein
MKTLFAVRGRENLVLVVSLRLPVPTRTVILTRVGSNVVHVHERRARKIDWERASKCEIDHDIERQRRFFWGRRL